jgi:pilus assembly protein CpaC
VVGRLPRKIVASDDGFAPASDSQSTLLAQINRIYGISGRVEPIGSFQGNFGFIID